jgi:tRNA(Ile)-lysidine synthase TilS/MesJ
MIKFSKEIMELAFRKMPSCNQIKILCSTGVDSIAASHYYHTKVENLYGDLKYEKYGITHFNHQLRPQNDLMENNFETFSNDCNIPRFSPIPLKSMGYYSDNTEQTEDSLRKARLAYIKNNSDNIIFITAHHLDDATESYMMNVLRGKEGFLPIPFITEVGTNLIVHPFLFTKKTDFIDYVCKNEILRDYVVEDETNKITKGSRRNFIRNEIMPLLNREKMGLSTIVEKKMKERLFLEIIKG